MKRKGEKLGVSFFKIKCQKTMDWGVSLGIALKEAIRESSDNPHKIKIE